MTAYNDYKLRTQLPNIFFGDVQPSLRQNSERRRTSAQQ